MKYVELRRPHFDDRRSHHIFYKVKEISEDQWKPSLIDANWEALVQLVVDEVTCCQSDRQDSVWPSESIERLTLEERGCRYVEEERQQE